MVLLPLCLFAFLAGFIDSMVGGGGLIQLPAILILLPDLSIPQAMGINKLASFCGTSVAAYRYTRSIKIQLRATIPTAIVAFAFSLLGAQMVSLISKEIMKPIIVILLLVVGIYTFIRKDFGKFHIPKLTSKQEVVAGLLVGAVLGLYDGFFGPGTGSFLMFAYVALFGFDFLQASASSKITNLATNLAALLYFAYSGAITLFYALPMAIFNISGSYCGAHVAISKGSTFVRLAFLFIVFVLALKLGAQ